VTISKAIATFVISLVSIPGYSENLHVSAAQRELPKRHANAFHYKPVVALVGDGHTYLQTPHDSAECPIEFVRFWNDYRIASVFAELENALCARVLKVHETPVSRAGGVSVPSAVESVAPR